MSTGAGKSVTRRLVRRLVREFNLYPVQKKLFKKTTDSNHDLGFSPNLLEQNFTTSKPNEVWVNDITYVWTGEGWSYLATVIDLYSRRIVGWAMDSNMKADLVARALQRALTLRCPGDGLIVHTGRGSQYASLGPKQAITCPVDRAD